MSLLTAEDVQSVLQQFANTAMQDSLSVFAAALREGIRSDLQSIIASNSQAQPSARASGAKGNAPMLDTTTIRGATAGPSPFDFQELHAPTPSQQGGAEGMAAADASEAVDKLLPGGLGDEADPRAEMPRRWDAARAKMQKIRAVIPTTPVVAQELRELGYFKAVIPKLSDVRQGKSDSIAHKLMLHPAGSQVEDEGEADGPMRSKSGDYKGLPNQRVVELVRGNHFEVAVLSAICLNALFIGVETNAAATVRAEYLSRSAVFLVIEIAFMVFFAAELAMRLFVFRWWFFRSKAPSGRRNQNFRWNLFDFSLVTLQLLDALLRSMVDLENSILGKATVLRFLRVLRIARLLRMGKVLRFFRTLRTIVHSILHSASLFIWALCSLLLLYYLFAVYITEVVMDDLHVESPDEDLRTYFGSVKKSMLSLAMGCTGGIDWGDLYNPISNVSEPFAGYPLYVYLMFLTIVTMNVFTGVIFDSVQKRDRQENELELLASAFQVFQRTDTHGTGTITKADFRMKVKDNELQKFFSTIDLDIQQAEVLFDLLDMSNDGCLSCSEFLRGCMRLQGTTKALDLLILSREVSQLFDSIVNFNRQSEEAAAVQRKHLMDLMVENQRLLRTLSAPTGGQQPPARGRGRSPCGTTR